MSAPVLGYASPSASARSVLMGLLLLLFSAAATAYTPLEIGPDFETLDLQPYVQLAIDEHDDLGPEQVLDQTDLRLNTSARNNLGFMAKRLWIRRSSNARLAALLGSSDRRTGPMAVIMLDIDHFKTINDRFGHQTGDRVLVAVAEVLRRNTSPDGVCGRYGGEELLMADAVADWQAAAELGDRLLKRIASLRFDADSTFSITASLGIALALPKPGIVAEELVQRADKALYSAKREGRNRAVFAPDTCRPHAAHVVPLRS